jgi:sec-independent protein translocase protein TatA
MGPIGLPELGIVLVVVLLIFGPKRLPQMGRSLGSGMREFKDGISGKSSPDDDEAEAEEARHREIAAAHAVDEPAVAPPAAKDPQGSPPS